MRSGSELAPGGDGGQYDYCIWRRMGIVVGGCGQSRSQSRSYNLLSAGRDAPGPSRPPVAPPATEAAPANLAPSRESFPAARRSKGWERAAVINRGKSYCKPDTYV